MSLEERELCYVRLQNEGKALVSKALTGAIDLDRRPDRRAQFSATNRFLSEIRRFPGFDGRSVDQERLIEQLPLDCGRAKRCPNLAYRGQSPWTVSWQSDKTVTNTAQRPTYRQLLGFLADHSRYRNADSLRMPEYGFLNFSAQRCLSGPGHQAPEARDSNGCLQRHHSLITKLHPRLEPNVVAEHLAQKRQLRHAGGLSSRSGAHCVRRSQGL